MNSEEKRNSLVAILAMSTVPFFTWVCSEYIRSQNEKTYEYSWGGPDRTAMMTMEIFRLGLICMGIIEKDLRWSGAWLVAGLIETGLFISKWMINVSDNS